MKRFIRNLDLFEWCDRIKAVTFDSEEPDGRLTNTMKLCLDLEYERLENETLAAALRVALEALRIAEIDLANSSDERDYWLQNLASQGDLLIRAYRELEEFYDPGSTNSIADGISRMRSALRAAERKIVQLNKKIDGALHTLY